MKMTLTNAAGETKEVEGDGDAFYRKIAMWETRGWEQPAQQMTFEPPPDAIFEDEPDDTEG